ncbi:MAG: 5-(carboxyamino)imidazole ribonucleotide synthase [Gammaproteobacteria bacterium]|nr:5-(carboxyamino)imidazole ribonucleotide synthase [Gammaproteobacteria bacterium]MDH3431219.1 5-(carboxyamino)imidazole ribonucleotide synthase [Gammaproteobacteria bacterium]MDH3432756.1 5-(carboxyamino)imidazole ribonucleotide synthase [Gammaproteobacteria bacterium]
MRIGIIGAGQLGQMLGHAATDLGHSCYFLDPSTRPPAARVGPVIQARFDDPAALAILAEKCDVLTYEFENVAVDALVDVAKIAAVYPSPSALRHAQDRLTEKQLFERLDIPIPLYRPIESAQDLADAATAIGLPLVVKTRRMGYDGKGQAVLHEAGQIEDAWQALGGSALIAEQWVDFDYEVSAIGVRNAAGDIATYSLTQNEHAGGILRVSRAPVEDVALTERAERYIHRLLKHLDYVGVLALELFVLGEKLLANEFAPRVHNSGHWTIEGAATSQFTNHLLAITNQHPGPTGNLGHAGMLNLIGTIPQAVRQLDIGWLHDYGKTPRTDRKLGHITVVADSSEDRDRQLREISDIVTRSTGPEGTGA